MLMPFDYLVKKYNIHPKGVMHLGSNDGDEAKLYYENGVEKTFWVEALPEAYSQLEKNKYIRDNFFIFNVCIGENDGEEVEFNVSNNNGQSSSIFDFGTHATDHPDVLFIDKIKLKTTRMDSLIEYCKIDIKDYPFLNIDLQGSELIALKSMGKYLKDIQYCYVEINTKEVYRGCPFDHEVISYLQQFGFKEIERKMTKAGWGDCFLIKESLLN